jgi:hypothetical protein
MRVVKGILPREDIPAKRGLFLHLYRDPLHSLVKTRVLFNCFEAAEVA